MTNRVNGLNHITFAVSDLDRALAFYQGILGCTLRARWLKGAYLEAGSLWLCLLVGPVTPGNDYTHVAFSLDQGGFEILSERVRAACSLWQTNSSEGSSVYMLDPDGHRLELHVGSLTSRLAHYQAQGRSDVQIHAFLPEPSKTNVASVIDLNDALVASWSTNADRWSDVVRSGAIASRRLVTDEAVIQAVMRDQPAHVLDLGCGEGWLARALAPHVERVVGVDVSPELIARAREAGGAMFHQACFADLIANPAGFGRDFDVVVANFALLDDGLELLLRALVSVTRPGGTLIVQTLHPATVSPPYQDGWRQEDFLSFGERWAPMPWYFRTMGTWLREIGRHWRLEQIDEPFHPVTMGPASLIISAKNVHVAF